MKRLSEEEYTRAFGHPMKRLAKDAAPPFDFWPYFESIPEADFEGHDCRAGSVSYVWENDQASFQHVLINSEDKNVFMVLVLDLQKHAVHGHRLLDLNQEYGLPVPSEKG